MSRSFPFSVLEEYMFSIVKILSDVHTPFPYRAVLASALINFPLRSRHPVFYLPFSSMSGMRSCTFIMDTFARIIIMTKRSPPSVRS